MRRAFALVAIVAASATFTVGAHAAPCKGKQAKKPACIHAKPKPKPKPPPAPATLAQRLSLGAQVFDLVDGFGSLWARVGADKGEGGDTIERIDPATNTITAKITVGKGFGLAVGDGAIWAPNYSAQTLTRIDPTTNGITAVIPLPDVSVHTVTTTPGAVWAGTLGAVGASGLLVKVDVKTNAVVGTTVIWPSSPAGVFFAAANSTAVWMITGGVLGRVDAATGAATQLPGAISNDQSCADIAAADDGIWVAGGSCLPHFSLEKLDPTTGAVTAQVQIPQAISVALGIGSVWATTQASTLVRLDPATAKVLGSMPIDLARPNVVHTAFGSIWIGDSSGALERFSPK